MHTLIITKINIPYNLAKRIVVFVSKLEKVIIRLDELRQFLKECRYPEYVISKSIFNAKLQGPAANSERSRNVIPFVTTCYPNIDNKSLMQTVKNKFKNIRNEHLKHGAHCPGKSWNFNFVHESPGILQFFGIFP